MKRGSSSRALAVVTACSVTAVLAVWAMAVGAGAADTPPTSTSTSTPTIAAETGAAPTKIRVRARSFAFTPSKLTIASGQRVTIALKSTDINHDFVVNGPGLVNKQVVNVKGGKRATGKLVLPKPGTYQFYCSIPGHRAAGMRGTITAT
jgi:plastocyanin